jgi:hypothetical protein
MPGGATPTAGTRDPPTAGTRDPRWAGRFPRPERLELGIGIIEVAEQRRDRSEAPAADAPKSVQRRGESPVDVVRLLGLARTASVARPLGSTTPKPRRGSAAGAGTTPSG